MDALKLVESSKLLDGYYQDLVGIASRVFPTEPVEKAVQSIAQVVLDYTQMWHDVGNQDPIVQSEHFKGYHPLFLDVGHTELNPNLRPEDYLEVFRSFMQRWAARKQNSDPVQDWYQAQDEFAQIISPSAKIIE